MSPHPPTNPASPPSLPTPAAENLADILHLKSKARTPQNVTFFPPPPQTQPQTQSSFAPPPPAAAQQVQGQAVSGNATYTSADPVRYLTWGPKTVFFIRGVDEGAESKRRGKKSARKRKSKKDDDDDGVRFEKVVLHGSEEMQTTERTEVLGLSEGGGVRRTWVVTCKVVVVAVEREVEGRDVRLEGEGDGDKDGVKDKGRGDGGGMMGRRPEGLEREMARLGLSLVT